MSNVAQARGRPVKFADRRHEVLRVAARIFSREGFRQATLAGVAQALDMTRSALYYYAESKDELLAQCAEIARGELEAALAEAQREPTGLARLRKWFVSYASITCDDFGRCFVLTDGSEMNAEMRARNRSSQLRLGNAVVEMAKKGMRDGSVARRDPADISRALFGIFNGMARWYRPTAKRTSADMASEMLAAVLTGIGKAG